MIDNKIKYIIIFFSLIIISCDIFNTKENDSYVDNVHYTPYGNSIIANKIYESLIKSSFINLN